MRWVVEQRPDIIEGYLSGKALLRGGNPDASRLPSMSVVLFAKSVTSSSPGDDKVDPWDFSREIQLKIGHLSWQNTCDESLEQHYAARS